jgi:hypothetical protein
MEEIIPFIVFATLLTVVVPLIFMFLKHQQKMAAILHDRNNQLPPVPTTDPMLVHELSRLRDVVAQQTIALDNLTSSHQRLEAKLAESDELQKRLKA